MGGGVPAESGEDVRLGLRGETEQLQGFRVELLDGGHGAEGLQGLLKIGYRFEAPR